MVFSLEFGSSSRLVHLLHEDFEQSCFFHDLEHLLILCIKVSQKFHLWMNFHYYYFRGHCMCHHSLLITCCLTYQTFRHCLYRLERSHRLQLYIYKPLLAALKTRDMTEMHYFASSNVSDQLTQHQYFVCSKMQAKKVHVSNLKICFIIQHY